MKRLSVIMGAATLLLTASGAFAAGNVEAGKAAFLAKGCVGCHGMDAKSPISPTYPKLAGLDASVVVEQLHAFKSGTRQSPIMAPIVAGLSDADIDNIAAYLASLK